MVAGEARSGRASIGVAVRDGGDYVINGRKWWLSGACDPRCKVFIFMGKTDAEHPDRHKRQSMILIPRDTPGVDILRGWKPRSR